MSSTLRRTHPHGSGVLFPVRKATGFHVSESGCIQYVCAKVLSLEYILSISMAKTHIGFLDILGMFN